MITTNTGAKKMEGTDEWRQIVATSGGAHNDTVDAYDRHIEALQDSLGIVVNGKQAAVNAAIGQYVILRNSTIVDSGTDMLPDGLYTAAKAISANTDIDKTYLTAVSSGGLNSLNSKFKSKAPYSLCSVEQKTTGSSSSVGAGSTVTQSVYAAISGKTILGIVGIVGGSYSSSCAISEYYISNNTAYVVWRNCSSSSINLGATKIAILYRENEPI